MNNPVLAKAAAAYNAKAAAALSAATSHGTMIQGRVTRELIRKQAARSDVHNLLAAIVAGLNDGMADPALRPFCEMAKEEVEAAMIRISQRHPCRAKAEA